MSDTILFDQDGTRVPSWRGEYNRLEFGPRYAVTDPAVYALHGWKTAVGSVTLSDENKCWHLRYVAFRRGGRWSLERLGWDDEAIETEGTLDQFQLQDILREGGIDLRREPRTFPTVASLEMYVRMKSCAT